MIGKIELIATTAFGLESVVSRELEQLGYKDQRVENGKVIFWGDEKAICHTNLWMRSADRILLKVGQFSAVSFDELFEKTKALPWTDWLGQDACFPVQGKSVKSQLFSVSDCQAIVKKAIVEKMKMKYRKEWFEEKGPRYLVEVSLVKDVATLTIDTSGSGLHKRGYRTLTAEAPMRETLAAALILLSRWHPDRPFMDPLCGSGTIPIEAGLIAMNVAPGLGRSFDSEKWPQISGNLWGDIRQEARSLIKHDYETHIIGTDIDGEVLSLARYHAKQAGLEDKIHFQKLSVADMSTSKKYGTIICNPPYGERLGERRGAEELYRQMGKSFRKHDTWSYFILTSHLGFERFFGKRADKKRKLFNGRLECNYFHYFGPRPPWLSSKTPDK